MSAEYDYIIVGGGSAGCALAARLCEEKDIRVLLVEAGGDGRSLFTRMPAGNGLLIGHKKFDWGFKSIPQKGMFGGKIYYPRGRGLGGSSLLNGMIYIRGNPRDYDRWAANGVTGWSYAEVLPYFKRSAQASHRNDDVYHGNGPMKLSPAGNYNEIDQAFVKACVQAGAPPSNDFNGENQRGAGRLDAKVFNGVRQSAAQVYLCHKPDNLTIKTNCRALKIEFNGDTACGLKLDKGTVTARREVIVSLGAFQSPQLLMLSGIGPAEHLAEHGISSRVDSPVGQILFDHPNMPLQFGVKHERLSMARYQRLDRAAIMGLQYMLTRTGPAAAPFWSALLFHALRDKDMPELEVFCTPMMVKEEGEGGGWNLQTLMNPGRSVIARGKMARPGVQLDINLLRPKSSGCVRLKSGNPLDDPVIDPGYFSKEFDVNELVQGVKYMRKVAAQDALKDLLSEEISPGSGVQTDEEIAEAVRKLATTGHHPVSTCRMGGDDDAQAVLDNELRVRGVKGLRVVDASSFPDQISGNLNAPVIMMAEKAADMILGKNPLPPESLVNDR